ncbi:HN1_G0016050.mRNA.1.CDS.1 [Saccharomyces cerevisiae]|nr:HN1_G0016050.mRNA.1.CDS.1 [Saccharomyces cerevisiae]
MSVFCYYEWLYRRNFPYLFRPIFSHCSHILKRSFLHNQCFLLLNILLAFSEF